MKFLTLVISLFLVLPSFASPSAPSGSGVTDEDLEYIGQNDGDFARPRSIQIPLLKGVISYTNGTIVNTFYFDLGPVTFQVIDEAGEAVLTQTANAVSGGKVTVDIKDLPEGNYVIVCYIPNEASQVASFLL